MEARFLEMLFSVLESNNIECVVLRGYKNLPKIIHNDVDFFVSPSSLDKFTACLLGVSKEFTADVKIILIRQGVVKCKVESSEFCIHIDFWYNLTFWGFSYSNGTRLLLKKKYVSSGNFYIPDALGEFEISFLKELFHNQKIRCDKIDELFLLLERSSFEQDSFIGNASNKLFLVKAFKKGSGKHYYLFFVFLISLVKWNIHINGLGKLFSSIVEFFSIKFFSSRSSKIKNQLITQGNILLDSDAIKVK